MSRDQAVLVVIFLWFITVGVIVSMFYLGNILTVLKATL